MHGDRARVGEVPLRSGAGRAGLVDRHQHRAGEPDGEVDQRPLVAWSCDEADLVAGLDAGGDEALGEGDHLALELGGGDVAPAVAVGQGEQREIGRRLDPLDQQVGGVRLRIGGDDGGDFELVHGNSFGTGRTLGEVLLESIRSALRAIPGVDAGARIDCKAPSRERAVGEGQRCSRSGSTSAEPRSPAPSSSEAGEILAEDARRHAGRRSGRHRRRRRRHDRVASADGHEVAAAGVAAAGFIDATAVDRLLRARTSTGATSRSGERSSRGSTCPITIDNDANAAGWAEFRFGAGRDVERHDRCSRSAPASAAPIVTGGRLFRGGFGARRGARPPARRARRAAVRLRAARLHRAVRLGPRAAARWRTRSPMCGGIGLGLADACATRQGALDGRRSSARSSRPATPARSQALRELGHWLGQACASLERRARPAALRVRRGSRAARASCCSTRSARRTSTHLPGARLPSGAGVRDRRAGQRRRRRRRGRPRARAPGIVRAVS